MFDGVLGLSVPKEATLVGFAINLVVDGKHSQDVELYKSETICAIKTWMKMVKQDLTEDKTQAALITNSKENNTFKIRHEVVPKCQVKLQGAFGLCT